MWMWLFLTIAASATGGHILYKVKFPGGVIVGAIIGAAVLNVVTGRAFMFSQAQTISQSITGAYIGCLMTRDRARYLPKVIKPYLVVMASLLTLNLCVGSFFFWITDYDLLTCLFCAAPGGMSDTPLVAMDMGANGAVVAVMQFVRMIFGMGCLPGLILMTDRLMDPEQSREMDQRAKELEKHRTSAVKEIRAVRFVPILAAAVAAGFVGKWTGMPAGTIAFSFLVVSIMNICGLVPPMPIWMRRTAQIFTGCCIGTTLTLAHVLQMRQLAVPMVVLCLGYGVCCVCMGLFISRRFRIEQREAMLFLSPAGASEMALIAAELGVESVNLVVLQIGRLVGVSVVFPHIFHFIVTVLS